MDSIRLGVKDLSRVLRIIKTVVYESTPLYIGYTEWVSYSEKQKEKMRKMWSRLAVKEAKKFLKL